MEKGVLVLSFQGAGEMGQRIVWGSPRGHFLDVLIQALPLTVSVPLRRLSENFKVLICYR